jgi:hypothetical protein
VKQQRTMARGAGHPAMPRTLPPLPPNWDAFQPHSYFKQNYAFLRGDDRRFLERLRDFFGAALASPDRPRRGIDVGSGANLYPALTMLPLCDQITLLEYGAKNCQWLSREVQRFSPLWAPYWRTLQENPAYTEVGPTNNAARRALARAASVEQGSIFDLPTKHPATFDVGTMFFVAESITDKQERFHEAIDAFLTCLRPDAPFAAAFMRNSSGYFVGDQEFPAFQIDESHIREYLRSRAQGDLEVVAVDARGQFTNGVNIPDKAPTWKLRPGYDGMILALGHAK